MPSGEKHLPRGQRRNTGPCSRRPCNQTAQTQLRKRHLALRSRELGDAHPAHCSLLEITRQAGMP